MLQSGDQQLIIRCACSKGNVSNGYNQALLRTLNLTHYDPLEVQPKSKASLILVKR